MSKGYVLADVVKRNQENPTTFLIPSESIRTGLRVGDYAKLVFEGPGGGDRMWIKIAKPSKPGLYQGELLNEPVMVKGVHRGETITFGPEHVAGYEREEGDTLYEPGLIKLDV